jgi:tRNA G18 (ribose-2'-O)-methylase SpoU
MGSAFRVPIARVESLAAALDVVRAAGIRIFAAVPRGGTPVQRTQLTGPAAIVLGGEGSGLSGEMIDRADELLTIEMRPPVESLNVSVAAALVLYEASRQRADVAV